MFTNERFNEISQYLKEHKRATVSELSALIHVSEATVRRDLIELQKMGVVARTHGGALYIENTDEVSIFVRLEKDAREKEITAEIALKNLPDFKTVFIDNSSTCLALAKRMDLTHKTVITNGLQIALNLSKKEQVNIIMPGGEVRFNTNSVSGSLTCHALRTFNIDLMLCSCAALNENGCYEYSIESTQLKLAAFEQSKRRILIADANKFKLSAPYRTSSLDGYDAIITNADDETLRPYRERGLNVVNK